MSDDNFLVTRVKSYSPQYTDKGSGAAEDVSFFARSSEQPMFGHYTLSDYFGQRPVKGYPSSADVTTVEFMSREATRKVGGGSSWWKQLWNDKGSGKPDDYTCWTIREESIPKGYVCLSPCFFKVQKNGQGRLRDPPTDAEVLHMVLVKEDLVSYVPASSLTRVWTDRATHAEQYLAIYTYGWVGCFGCNNKDWAPPSGRFPILNVSKGRLAWEWGLLSQAVSRFAAGVTLIPNMSIGDATVLSSSKDRIYKVWAENKDKGNFRAYKKATYDCEDFAFEMRAAAARDRADSDVCVRAESGGFCGVVYVRLPGVRPHAMNLVLLPDETLELFEPQTGQFKSMNTIDSIQHAIY